MILVGELALWVALLMAAWGAIVSFAGGTSARAELVASGERAIHATCACLVLATAGLLVALVSSDFSLQYVATVTSANLPTGFKVTALWTGEAGGMLSWTVLLSTCAALAVASNATRQRLLMPYVAGTLSVILLFFIAVLCFDVNPYERLAPIPVEGHGMHPDRQHVAMAVHPTTLYVGYATAVIPFAFAAAALIARRIDEEALLTVRRWATVAWFFITLGIVSGMWWTYVDAGTAWEWLRDPIERSSLFPWIAATAFLAFAMRRRTLGDRVRAARYTVYIGVLAFLIACGGFALRREREVTLGPGEAATLVDVYRREWTFTSQGLSDFPELNRAVDAVPLRVTRAGAPAGIIVTERRQYVDSRGTSTFEPAIEPGIDPSLVQDTYVVLTTILGDHATLRVAFYPLMAWAWIGGIAVAIGGAMALWPAPPDRRAHV